MGVAARFYQSYARFLCEQGFDVVRFDYDGMGNSKSGSLRNNVSTMQSWAVNDLATVSGWIKSNLKADSLFIIGHSAGGQLAGISKSTGDVDAMLLVASQSGYWRHWAGFKKLPMCLLWYVFIPVLTRVFGFFPAKALRLGEDLPKQVALEWAKWGRSPDYIASDVALAKRFEEFPGPILAYSFSDDSFAPIEAVESLLGFYSNASIEHRKINAKHYSSDGIGHVGFFRKKTGSLGLWAESANWLKSNTKIS